MMWLDMPIEITRYHNGSLDVAIWFKIPSVG